MAVESFLPSETEPKITIEKTVKEKPSVQDLTIIESPGRPVPASVIVAQNRERKGKRVKKTANKENQEAPYDEEKSSKKVKRDSILIITEKPQAALKIASALGDARKYAENNVPFYELVRNGERIIVACAVGHLFNLTYSPGQVGWPIFKMEWTPSFKKAAFTKRYYDLIKKLAPRAKEIIVATDYDIEGEVIGWNIVRFIAKKQDAKRMKFSTLTKPEIEKAYDHALNTLDWKHAYAGEARHQIDWLYGINLSRALMSAIKKAGSFRILSTGRIQGPALKIIVDREREISNFKSEPFWQVLAISNNHPFKHPKDIFNKEDLKEFEDIKEAQALTTRKSESLEPPHPFDLTTLQREAYNLHRISPSNTLKIAQKLYLDGLISYPRTSSQKIPKEIEPQKILKSLKIKYPEQVKLASRLNPVEGPKSDPAHPSIYPTGEFKNLENDDEFNIYELIVKRFISAFSPNAELARTNVTLNAKGKNFTANGTKILDKGWMQIYPTSIEESTVPELNGLVKVDEIKYEEKETQPPKRFTPASLITLLEKKNLGTKTTRSSIIDTLFDRGYLDGSSIKATPLGIKLIEALEKYSPIIIDENLTKDLEEKMENIDPKEIEKRREIIIEVEQIISNISQDFKKNELEIGHALVEGTQELRELQKEQSVIMPCPVCNKGSISIRYSKKTSRFFAACDQYPNCKTTYSLPPNSLIKTTGKMSENNLPLLMAIRKGKRPWIFEFNVNYKKENPQQTQMEKSESETKEEKVTEKDKGQQSD